MALPQEDGGMAVASKLMVKPMLILLSVATLAIAVYGLIQFTVRIPGRGTVKTVGVSVFWDGKCTNEVDFIDWGFVEPGSANNVSVYVRNDGNVASTLFLTTENWSPANASGYIRLNWNYSGQPLDPSEVAQVKLTLTVSPTIEGVESFSFDITIGING